MATTHTWYYLGAWAVMLLASIANGAVRDLTYGARMGELAAHQLSTITSVLLLGCVMWICIRLYPPSSSRHALVIGLGWAALTVAFECLFFGVVVGRPWSEVLANYNLLRGRIWVVVVLWLATAPLLFVHLGVGASRPPVGVEASAQQPSSQHPPDPPRFPDPMPPLRAGR
jgi:hypothetical protein